MLIWPATIFIWADHKHNLFLLMCLTIFSYTISSNARPHYNLIWNQMEMEKHQVCCRLLLRVFSTYFAANGVRCVYRKRKARGKEQQKPRKMTHIRHIKNVYIKNIESSVWSLVTNRIVETYDHCDRIVPMRKLHIYITMNLHFKNISRFFRYCVYQPSSCDENNVCIVTWMRYYCLCYYELIQLQKCIQIKFLKR